MRRSVVTTEGSTSFACGREKLAKKIKVQVFAISLCSHTHREYYLPHFPASFGVYGLLYEFH